MKVELSVLLAAVALVGAGAFASLGGATRIAISGDAAAHSESVAVRLGSDRAPPAVAASAQAGIAGAAADLADSAAHLARVEAWAEAFPSPSHDIWNTWVREVRRGFAGPGPASASLDAASFMPRAVGRSLTRLSSPLSDTAFGRIFSQESLGRQPTPAHVLEHAYRATDAIDLVATKIHALLREALRIELPADDNNAVRVLAAPSRSTEWHVDSNALTVTGTFLGYGTELDGAGRQTPRGTLTVIAGQRFEEMAATGNLPNHEHVRATRHREGAFPSKGERVVLLVRPRNVLTDDAAILDRVRDAYFRGLRTTAAPTVRLE